jgi:hypothetical protein
MDRGLPSSPGDFPRYALRRAFRTRPGKHLMRNRRSDRGSGHRCLGTKRPDRRLTAPAPTRHHGRRWGGGVGGRGCDSRRSGASWCAGGRRRWNGGCRRCRRDRRPQELARPARSQQQDNQDRRASHGYPLLPTQKTKKRAGGLAPFQFMLSVCTGESAASCSRKGPRAGSTQESIGSAIICSPCLAKSWPHLRRAL